MHINVSTYQHTAVSSQGILSDVTGPGAMRTFVVDQGKIMILDLTVSS